MVRYKTILKIIEEYTIKCTNSSKKATSIGDTATLKRHRNTYEINYEDGTHLLFDKKTHQILEMSTNGKTYKYPTKENIEKITQPQYKTLTNEKGMNGEWRLDVWKDGIYSDDPIKTWDEPYNCKDGFEFAYTYANQYATIDGMRLNKKLWKGEKLDNEPHETEKGIIYNKREHDYFVKLERKTRCDMDNICAVRYETNDNVEKNRIGKEYFTTRGHTGFTIAGHQPSINKTFYIDDSWTIINTIDKGSNARGLYLGNLLEFKRGVGADWEGELNIPPQTKYVQDIIDTENRVIIQHIEYQRGVA